MCLSYSRVLSESGRRRNYSARTPQAAAASVMLRAPEPAVGPGPWLLSSTLCPCDYGCGSGPTQNAVFGYINLFSLPVVTPVFQAAAGAGSMCQNYRRQCTAMSMVAENL